MTPCCTLPISTSPIKPHISVDTGRIQLAVLFIELQKNLNINLVPSFPGGISPHTCRYLVTFRLIRESACRQNFSALISVPKVCDFAFPLLYLLSTSIFMCYAFSFISDQYSFFLSLKIELKAPENMSLKRGVGSSTFSKWHSWLHVQSSVYRPN